MWRYFGTPMCGHLARRSRLARSQTLPVGLLGATLGVGNRRNAMITAIVNFQLPDDLTLDNAKVAFEASTPRYEGLAGLVRKYYLFDPETRVGGGVYLWESREAAEAAYNDAWRASISERYGVEPSVRYFESPVIVDNTLSAAAAE